MLPKCYNLSNYLEWTDNVNKIVSFPNLPTSFITSSVIRRKGKSQNGRLKKTKHAKFSEKQTFLPPDTHAYVCLSEGKKGSFFGKLGMLCFLETPVARRRFGIFIVNFEYISHLGINASCIFCRWLWWLIHMETELVSDTSPIDSKLVFHCSRT